MERVTAKHVVLVVAAYTAASLVVWTRLLPAPPVTTQPARSAPLLPLVRTAVVTSPSVQSNGCLLAFDVPVGSRESLVLHSVDFLLSSAETLRRCTVQVSAVSDCHRSYSHDYINVDVGPFGFRLSAPLRAASGYWRADGHSGEWSSWNVVAMRSLQVKIFPRTPQRAPSLKLECFFNGRDPSDTTTLRWLQPLEDPIVLGRRFELAFDLAGWERNPFDPEQLAVSLEVTPPAGHAARVHAFLYQNFEARAEADRERIEPKGAKHWRARFRPSAAGEHGYRLLLRVPGRDLAVLKEGIFLVLPGSRPDYIRVSERRPFYFEHGDGRFFYPMGWCVLCPVDRPHNEDYLPYLPMENSLAVMRNMLDYLADSGGNCTRFWLTDWWSGLEWSEHRDNYGGLGRYNLKNAWIVDQVLDHCETRGIRVLLATLNHLRTRPPDRRYGGAWLDNPYNTRNGGFLSHFSRFWIDPRVLRQERKRLRYVLSRFADSPAVHSWNYVSEADLAAEYNWWGTAERRISTLLDYIKSNDVYKHPATSHVADLELALSLSARPTADFMHSNAYASRAGRGILSEEQIDAIRAFAGACRASTKPCLVTEYGGRWLVEPDARRERDIIAGMWAGIASRLSGLPMAWWWNFNYGEDLGRYWRVAADFMDGEDLISEDNPSQGGWVDRRVTCNGEGGQPRALMVGNSTRRFLYVFNFETVGRTRLLPSTCRKTMVRCVGLQPGKYRAEFWDPRRGKTDLATDVSVVDGSATLHIPDFQHDWAVKLCRAEHAPNSTGRRPSADNELVNTQRAAPPARARTADEWLWRITPQFAVRDSRATDRCVCEVRIALPPVCRGMSPSVRDTHGSPVDFHWLPLWGGTGWHLQIPAQGGAPFQVTAVERTDSPPGLMDEERFGMTMAVAPLTRTDAPAVSDSALLATYDRASARGLRRLRVSRIEDVENPCGSNDYYMAYYCAPLLVPTDGSHTFAINSDDGSFLRIDGKTVVSWLGCHDMEVQNGPMLNLWRHRGSVELSRGIHWIEYYHQEFIGSQLARAAWLAPGPQSDVPARFYLDHMFASRPPDWQTIPDQHLDGRIPCVLDVVIRGSLACSVAPARGLELRRPRTRIHMAALRAAGEPAWRPLASAREGYTEVACAAGTVPVWLHSAHWRPFSLEWQQARTPGGACLKTMLHDMDCALHLRIGGRDLGERRHWLKQWCLWPLKQGDAGHEIDLSLAGVPVLRDVVRPWPAVLPATDDVDLSERAARRLLELAPAAAGRPIPGAAIRRWYVGPASGTHVTPAAVPCDIWSPTSRVVSSALEGRDLTDTAVAFVLDRGAYARGLTGAQVHRRIRERILDSVRIGALPVLILPADLDTTSERVRDCALAFVRLRDRFGCPLVDLRTEP